MPILGTKKFWLPAAGMSTTQKENQVLKNAGYINLQLYTVNYMSKGNFWQDTFGGKDRIAVATSIKYQKRDELIESAAVQDMRVIKVNQNYNLGIQRNLAVKIPANADSIALEVKITAVKDDQLQAKFDMLNQAEYQSALQLAPGIVGQVFTVTSLVKKLFADAQPEAQLEASYAGIISLQAEENPVSAGKLTKGMLVMISTNDGDDFSNADPNDLKLEGDTLLYKNKEVENTYIIFNVSFEPLKGDDEEANWFKKYVESLNILDKIQLTEDKQEIVKIYADSKALWIEGNTLIDADRTYINKEKLQIKNAAIVAIQEKYKALLPETELNLMVNTSGVLKSLAGISSFNTITQALPATGEFLKHTFTINPSQPLQNDVFNEVENTVKLNNLMNQDKSSYMQSLGENDLSFNIFSRTNTRISG
ncbi:hypothetical protein [Pedobacter sp. NJ-S-72]